MRLVVALMTSGRQFSLILTSISDRAPARASNMGPTDWTKLFKSSILLIACSAYGMSNLVGIMMSWFSQQRPLAGVKLLTLVSNFSTS